MENVTDRTSNPFGMSPPCPRSCGDGVPAVFGYGDANADVHVIGDHPGVHGGRTSGVPFGDTEAGRRVQSVLGEVGLLADPGEAPTLRDCFLSYLHMCCPPPGEEPDPEDYADLERFFDAELRAIAAHVLVPVGERPTAHVLEHYTARADRVPADPDALHATEVAGSGWLVLPLSEPGTWSDADRSAAVDALEALLARDYHQITDLGRFLATDDPYYVR